VRRRTVKGKQNGLVSVALPKDVPLVRDDEPQPRSHRSSHSPVLNPRQKAVDVSWMALLSACWCWRRGAGNNSRLLDVPDAK
jgi:hypothetical protein